MYHGNVDGGHTYRIVCDRIGENLDQYVPFEVMTGVEDIIESLAEARNTSVQVDQKSLAELAKHFDPIKEALEGMPFFKRIAFKQNQVTQDEETGKNFKMIDAREIVAIINMFDNLRYPQGVNPTQAYSSKAMMLNHYLDNPEAYRRYVNVIPDIFDLYDAVEVDFADAYNETGGRYGRKKYSGYKDGRVIDKSKFGQRELIYKVPDGFIYPTIAAFRCILEYDETSGKAFWKNDIEPIKVWDICKNELVSQIMRFAADLGDNPNSVGKNPNVWHLAYMTVKDAVQDL
jgi:hypothetical protein